jgi:ADP-ribose pyrophosphatase
LPDHTDVDLIEKTTPFKGYFQIDRYRLRHRKHDGGWTRDIVREVFERGHAVGVLLYDPALDSVLLIEQFRVGAYAAAMDAWQIEVVAGIIDAGETPEQVAVREAQEEAGCTVTDLAFICKYLVSPGGATESCTLYCGRADLSSAGGHHGLHEEDEDIRAFVVPVDEALRLLEDGRFGNAVTIIALQWLALHRAPLQQRWS